MISILKHPILSYTLLLASAFSFFSEAQGEHIKAKKHHYKEQMFYADGEAPSMSNLYLQTSKKSRKKAKSEATTTSTSKESQYQEEDLFIRAIERKLLGDYEDAAEKFLRIAENNPLNKEAFFQAAYIYYQLGEYDKAQKANEKALHLDDNNEWYYLLYGQIFAAQGDIKKAAAVYQKLIEIAPEDIDLYFDWAMLLSESEQYKEAIAVYDLIDEKKGISEETLVLKLPLYSKTEQYELAIENISVLIQEDSSQFRYYGYLGDMYENMEQFDQAIQAYEKILELNPGNTLAYYTLSEVYEEKGETEKKRVILKEAMSSSMMSVEDKIRLAIPLIQPSLTSPNDSYEYQLANELLNILLDEHADEIEVIGLATEIYQARGDNEQAIQLLQEKIEQIDDSEIHILYISSLSDERRYEEVHEQAVKSKEKYPEDPVFDYFEAFSASLTKQYKLAQAAYQSGLKKEFSNEAFRMQMLLGLGDVSGELKDYNTADDAYENALEIDPNNATVLNNYAYYLSVRNIELDRAERMSKKSNLLEENNAAFQDTYAWILYQKGAYSEALNWMEKAIKSSKGEASAELWEHYGDILFKLNQQKEAVKYWEKALELEPERIELQEKIRNNR